jgi:cyclohexa-1,5-dienecarbonyl-CoA hydratase
LRIQTRFDGAVAYVTLNHPPVNVIDFELIDDLTAFLAGIRGDPRLCAIAFQGAGHVFSAGVDVGAHLPATVERMIRSFHGVFDLLDDMCIPTLALVQGSCLGGACELAGCMDYVLATEKARFGLPEIKLGVFPPVAAALFPRRFAYQGAMHLLLTGETLDAEAALGMGIVSRVVQEADAQAALEEELQQLRRKSSSSLRAIKRAALEARGWSFRQLVGPSERVYLEQLMATADSVEGLNAFLEKREPVWTHA